MVNRIKRDSCEVTVLDMNEPMVADLAKALAIRSVPAVLIDGKTANCCAGLDPDEAFLKATGIGQSLEES